MDKSGNSSTASAPHSAKNPEWKLLIWETFEMSLPGEIDPELIQYHWHWLLFSVPRFLGPEQVYAIGWMCSGIRRRGWIRNRKPTQSRRH